MARRWKATKPCLGSILMSDTIINAIRSIALGLPNHFSNSAREFAEIKPDRKMMFNKALKDGYAPEHSIPRDTL